MKKGGRLEDKIEWLIILIVVVALIAYAMMTAGPKQAAQNIPPAYSAHLSLSVNPSYSGVPLVVSATLTNCGEGNATLRFDGKSVSYQQTDSEITASISPSVGTHKLEIESGRCKDSLSFETRTPLCSEGQKRACNAGRGCPGTQVCENNAWGACSGPARICSPGQKVPCAINSCVFGLTTCNACGTAWSACTAPK